MTMFCSHCGEELPQDTRFCSSCGAVRTARMINPSSIAGTGKTPENIQAVSNQMEQAAPMPPLRMKQHTEGEGFPTWMSKLQRDPLRTESPLKDKSQQVVAPQQQDIKSPDALAREPEQEVGRQSGPEVLHTLPVADHLAQTPQNNRAPEQQDFPNLSSTPQSFSSMRELRVKIWNEANSAHKKAASKEETPLQRDPGSNFADNKPAMGGGEARTKHSIEDVPTQSVESITAMPPPLRTNIPIDDMPTTPLLAVPDGHPQVGGQPQLSLNGLSPSLHGQNMYGQPKPEQAPDNPSDIASMSTMQVQIQGKNQAVPLPSPEAQRSMVPGGIIAPVSLPETPRPAVPGDAFPSIFRSGKGRLPLIVGASAVVLLLALALGSWIIIFEPFSVPPVTNVQQSYVDTKLGISLRYPGRWKAAQADYSKKTLTLLDVSDTNQMNIYVADATTGAQGSYVQQQAATLGISNPKAGSATTFGGASWQQIQGDMQVKGAEYTCVLFTTTYKKHFYTLTQMSPHSTYPDEEKLVFAPTRLSLHFL